MSSGVTVTVEDAELRAALARMIRAARDPRPALKAIGQVLVTGADLSFRAEEDPWGSPWAPLTQTTLARRRGSRAQILRDSGILANSISARVSGDSVEVGTDVIYAATHQFGRPDNRFYNSPRGRPAPIPARPSLPIRGGAADLPATQRADILDAVAALFVG
jgi:phage virion morphogenesis protein